MAITGPNDLRVGFVPLTDCAPLVAAQELGLYEKYGIRVSLSREIGWAAIREKIQFGELHAAHTLASMPLVATLGLGYLPCECRASMILSQNGNGITLSEDLWDRGVRDLSTLREEIHRSRGERILTLGMVFPHSSHNHLLRTWLTSGGIDPDRDVRLVLVPAPSMVSSLKSGNLDGYCVGEPYNSEAVRAGTGWCAITSIHLAPGHTEKVLMVTRSFAATRYEQHIALLAALHEACIYCQDRNHREQVAQWLAKPAYLNLPAKAILPGLAGYFNYGHGQVFTLPDLHRFHGDDLNRPTLAKGRWVASILDRGSSNPPMIIPDAVLRNVFASKFFDEARELNEKLASYDPVKE